MMYIYAGVGSRYIPTEIKSQLISLGSSLADAGWLLRSGAANGADAAFETGCDTKNGEKEIFLPWKGFNGSSSLLYTPSVGAYRQAQKYHPYYHSLSRASKSFMARNTHQMLGELLIDPVIMVICWTQDGAQKETTKETGGTGQCIRVAEAYNIPVFNLKNEGTLEKVVDFIDNL